MKENNNPPRTRHGVETEIVEVYDGKVVATASVEDTTGFFEAMDGHSVATAPVPGHPEMKYVLWGDDNQQPYELIRLIGQDEVTSQNKFFNVQTCYGMGVSVLDEATGKPTVNPEVKKWKMRQNLNRYFLEQCTDMKYFFWTIAVIILSRDGDKINRIVHKETCHTRLELADKRGRIRHAFYGNWKDGTPNDVEVISLLDEADPFGDLYQRMGMEPRRDGKMLRGTERKFGVIVRYPTVGCQYYPIPYSTAIFRGGSYDEKRLISVGKRSKLRNHVSVKYQVEVEQGYWERFITDRNITDELEAKKAIEKKKQEIRDFVAGIENSGKAWITGYYINPDGHAVSDIRVNLIDGNKEGGEWGDDVQVATNTICYGDNTHPNLVGATPGKSQQNNSGSDKRELFTMKQILEKSFHDMLMLPLIIVADFNKWDVTYDVPLMLLTTLDEHKDAKTVTIENK